MKTPTMMKTITCPPKPRYDGDLTGCGTTFQSAGDDEQLHDCPQCGLFFSEAAASCEPVEKPNAN